MTDSSRKSNSWQDVWLRSSYDDYWLHAIQHWATLRHMTDKLLTTRQVAERLNLDRRSVWNRVNAGTLTPAFKHPGTGAYLFDRETIDQLADKAAK